MQLSLRKQVVLLSTYKAQMELLAPHRKGSIFVERRKTKRLSKQDFLFLWCVCCFSLLLFFVCFLSTPSLKMSWALGKALCKAV